MTQEDFEEETASAVSRNTVQQRFATANDSSSHGQSGEEERKVPALDLKVAICDEQDYTKLHSFGQQAFTSDQLRLRPSHDGSQQAKKSQASSRSRSLTGSEAPAGRSTLLKQASRSRRTSDGLEPGQGYLQPRQTRSASSRGLSDCSEQLASVQEGFKAGLTDSRSDNAESAAGIEPLSSRYEQLSAASRSSTDDVESTQATSQKRPSGQHLADLDAATVLAVRDSSGNARISIASSDEYAQEVFQDFAKASPATQGPNFSTHQASLQEACNNMHDRYPEDDHGHVRDASSVQQQQHSRWASASHRFSQQVHESPRSAGQDVRSHPSSDLSLQQQVLSQNKLSISMPRPQTPDNSNLASHRPSDQAANDSHSPSDRTAYSYHAGEGSLHLRHAFWQPHQVLKGAPSKNGSPA